MSELPEGWAEAEIGELASYVSRGRSPKYVEKSALPIINQRCVRWHGVDETFVKFVDPATWHQWDDERLIRRNDILWNSTGTGTIGRAALFTELPSYDRAVVDTPLCRLGMFGPPMASSPSLAQPIANLAWSRAAFGQSERSA